MNPILFLNELIERFKTESPDFFKKLQAIALILAVISGVTIACDYLLINLPTKIDFIANTLFTISSTMFLTGKLPIKDKATETPQ